ncbi:HigA family addiction module antitoxin [Paraburkholderia acidisoli]|uniref:HigA family addiction module antidote protein n=1 Tax=Paraburkholderia acidisoli TaxID=2571748 RepID=A0A7Z2GHV1_9BURK|nr:HigA family addiction module antitoxin [Paraburkholderia acidisoli]QGZ62085.1 HigA family addiction module antidote protein [Paraburkholderia acidisoli]
MPRDVPLATPGEILAEDWLKPMSISQYALAKAIGVPPRRINEIVLGKRAITADTAVRLAVYFGTDARSWMELQAHYDTEIARETLAGVLANIRPHASAAAVTTAATGAAEGTGGQGAA